MKRKYRIADVIIQFALLFTWIILVFIDSNYAADFYFIVGAWFLISLIIHRLIDNAANSAYNIFITIVAGIIAVVLLGLVSPVLFIILYLLLFWGPIMAIFYTIVCVSELKKLGKRPISLLK